MKTPEVRLVTASDYYQSLVISIPKATRLVVIHAMNLLWGPQTEVLVPLLQGALKRGVEVRIVGDYYSKFQANRPKFVHRGRATNLPKWAHTRAINYRLEGDGAHVTYVGKIGLNPFKGRCHSKITIIDDLVYAFGGVNFSDDAFQNHDYMLETRDPALAQQLYKLVLEVEKDQKFDDIREKINGQTTLLYDGGQPGKSIIYETACDIVAKAKKVYYVSQMCPSGQLAKSLEKTDYSCYFIRPSQADTPANLALVLDKARSGIKNLYKGKGYIHAKLILCEYADGSKHLISGSNNYSWRGIAYGTKEIAVHSTDSKLWDALYEFIQQEIINDQPSASSAR